MFKPAGLCARIPSLVGLFCAALLVFAFLTPSIAIELRTSMGDLITLNEVKQTSPSLAVNYGGKTYYAPMTTDHFGHIRIRYNDLVYSVGACDFQVLEYLYFDGASVINTGIDPLGDIKIETEFQGTNIANSTIALFGSRYNHTSNSPPGLVFWLRPNSTAFTLDYGSNRQAGPAVDTNWHTLTVNNNVWTLDGVARTAPTTGGITSPYTIYLGNINASNQFATDRYFTGRVKYFRIYKSGVMVRNFIPSRRASDGVCGVWDSVTNTFFENIGPGNVSCGASSGSCL
ncbi:MAG: hypothetical protein FWG18_01930 [Alphaproteobacteria bacterium]|nr:hypothetical protein [Alphaproteobacteria bacterium]